MRGRGSWGSVSVGDVMDGWDHPPLKATSRRDEDCGSPGVGRTAQPLGARSRPPVTLRRVPTDRIAPRRRPSAWTWLVAGSALVMVVCALVLGVWWLASSETQIATYSVRGAVSQVRLDLAGANAVV